MRKGLETVERFEGLYVVHQNVPGKRTRDLSFAEPVVFFPLQGEIFVEGEGEEKFTVGPGRLLYLPGAYRHSFSSSERQGERLIALLDPQAWRSHSLASDRAVCVLLNPVIREILLYLLMHPRAPSRGTLVESFFATLAESLATQSQQISSASFEAQLARASDPRLLRAIEGIRHNFEDEELSLEQVAKKAGLALRSFHRLALKECGLAPKQMLIHFRILAACERLALGRESVTEVAFGVGYRSLSAFIEAFRSLTGQLPSDFR